MVKTNNIWVLMSDVSIIKAIGIYIKEQRLQQNKTQAQLAETAGINRWTLGQIENGEAITLLSLIQILRALDVLHVFNTFVVEQQISPIALAKLEKKQRQRASSSKKPETGSEW